MEEGAAPFSTARSRAVVVKDLLALVCPLLRGGVPLEVALAHQLLHGVATAVLAVQAALPHARPVAEVVVLVLRAAAVACVVVAGNGGEYEVCVAVILRRVKVHSQESLKSATVRNEDSRCVSKLESPDRQGDKSAGSTYRVGGARCGLGLGETAEPPNAGSLDR